MTGYIIGGVITLVLAWMIWRNRPRTDDEVANEIAEAEYREWKKGEAANTLRMVLNRENDDGSPG